ncbi:MAG: peptide deformylase [Chlorobiaceae bacterium]|nr:peptide deformylase [Chlorobiaceae bacterium]NTW11407.1 peptide deformylase [Chlorobiaceae bacterium]
MILPINIYSDEVLKKKARPMKGVDGSTRELIEAMFDSMRNASGIGLAAPQVGYSIRLLVVDVSCMKEYASEKPMVVINPYILSTRGSNIMEEGCLSVPGVEGDVLRPATITLKYRDENFKENTGEFSGMIARVLQHEIDHLDGTLFVDKLEKRDRRKIQGKLDELSAGIVNASYPHSREMLHEAQAK